MTTFETITRIWEQVFAVKKFTVEDTFISLNGNAKLADKLFLLVQEEFGSNLPISPTIAYDYPTIAKQSAYLEELKNLVLPLVELKARRAKCFLMSP